MRITSVDGNDEVLIDEQIDSVVAVVVESSSLITGGGGTGGNFGILNEFRRRRGDFGEDISYEIMGGRSVNTIERINFLYYTKII